MAITALKQQILEVIFKSIPRETCAVFLFGSFAHGRISPASDIDIGVVADKPLENRVLVRIRQDLEQVKTLREIDVVDFSGSRDKEFLKIALKEVRVWHQTKKSKAYLRNLMKRLPD